MTEINGRPVIDPLRPGRNLAEVFLMGLALWMGLSPILVDPEPFSVGQLLGTAWAAVWSVTLVTGGLTVLVGLLWWGQGLTGLTLMQLGYLMFTFPSLARGLALVEVGRTEDAVIVLVFALVAAGRQVQIERLIVRHLPGARLWSRWRQR